MDQITKNELDRQQKVINNLAKRLSDLEKTSYNQQQILEKLHQAIILLS